MTNQQTPLVTVTLGRQPTVRVDWPDGSWQARVCANELEVLLNGVAMLLTSPPVERR